MFVGSEHSNTLSREALPRCALSSLCHDGRQIFEDNDLRQQWRYGKTQYHSNYDVHRERRMNAKIASAHSKELAYHDTRVCTTILYAVV